MKILCVEDGSVDIDAIENGDLALGKVLVYRQGATPPFVIEIDDRTGALLIPNGVYKSDKILTEQLRLENNELKQQLAEYESELAEMVRENEFLKDRLANKYSELDDFNESELGEQEEALN